MGGGPLELRGWSFGEPQVHDPDDPSRLAAAYDGGDGMQLSPAGNERMALEVDLAQLKGRDCSIEMAGD